MIGLDATIPPAYVISVSAKTLAGINSPLESRRIRADHHLNGAFFVSAFNGGRVGEAERPASFLDSWSVNPFAVAPFRLTADGGDSIRNLGVTMMNPLSRTQRARAHRRMAYSALASNSSLTVRWRRYRHHAAKARQLEGQEVAP